MTFYDVPYGSVWSIYADLLDMGGGDGGAQEPQSIE